MIRVHPYFKKVFRHILVWTVALAFLTFLREFGQKIDSRLAVRLTMLDRLQFQLILGFLAGFLFGSYAYLTDRFLSRRFSFGRMVFISGLGYLAVIIILILLAFSVLQTFIDSRFAGEDLRRYFANGNHIVLIVYCFIVGFLIEFIQELDLKFGPGNLWKMLKGTYYHPVAEERVVMFLDMRSSTTHAEKLGHIKYSRLIQDCFQDISVVADHAGQIYQYVGDEAILTWDGQTGFDNNNCVNAFFAYQDQLASRRAYYQTQYGLEPEFKAGVNVGDMTIAEVGDIKREIAFLGDAINTAARVQSMCNELGHDLLVSGPVVDRLADPTSVRMQSVGDVSLKGKTSGIEIYVVDRIQV
jgi:adenylate cyclase